MSEVLDTQTTEVAQSTAGTAIDVGDAKVVGLVAAITVSTPSAGAFTAADTDICTKATHGMKTGLKVQVSTDGVLPAGLAAATDYFVIVLTANTFKLASSLVNANAGTAVDITDAGTGTHTITPTALAGASIKLQGSMDNSAWADIGIDATGDATKSSSITATSNIYLRCSNPGLNYVRAYTTLTAGQLSLTLNTLLK